MVEGDALNIQSSFDVNVTGNVRGSVSALGGANALTLTARTAVGAGSFGAAQPLTSGAASILGGAFDPDRKLRVLLTASDCLGVETAALRELPTRAWAMKFDLSKRYRLRP